MDRQRPRGWTTGTGRLAAALLAAWLGCATAAAGQQAGAGFRFDAGLGWSTMSETMYSDARWSSGALVNVEEYWRLDFKGSVGPSPIEERLADLVAAAACPVFVGGPDLGPSASAIQSAGAVPLPNDPVAALRTVAGFLRRNH